MILLLDASVQYCEEYRFGYHVMDCPDDTEGVYKYEDEYYFLMSNGTLMKNQDGEYISIENDIESVQFYDNSLMLLKYDHSLARYSKGTVEPIEFKCQNLLEAPTECNGTPF